jgi:DUF1365 family protein
MICADLDHLDELNAISPLLGFERHRPIRFCRGDYLGDSEISLKDAVLALVEERIGLRPTGKVLMLANLRTLGWCFNPIVSYWCFNEDGSAVAQVLSVTNTPWHEHHAYVLTWKPVDSQPWEFPKTLHVSPFYPMELTYRFSSGLPESTLRFSLDLLDAKGRLTFSATLVGHRVPLSTRSLLRLLWVSPTQKVSLSIYAHAARLRAKGTRFVPHPKQHQE